MATNDVLDRLEKLAIQAAHGSFVEEVAYIDAIRNAAPALIRLARAVLAVDNWYDKSDYELKLAYAERAAAITALGKVRL